MSHSFISEGMERVMPTQNETTETSRRYVQWKEEDVGLLLNDLEQPGHYTKWKENKSGYSKRVAEAVFKNVMYHEAIKFKVRWLESRYKRWHQLLSSLDPEDRHALETTTERMMKEFPYYERCKPIFERKIGLSSLMPIMHPNSHSPVIEDSISDSSSSPETKQEHQDKTTQSLGVVERPAGILSTAPDTNFSLKRKRVQNYSYAPPPQHNGYRITDTMTEDRRLKVMTLELESKKMEHEERMQEMKLEQLRLEIELQKLKRPTHSPNMNGSFQ